MERREPSMAEEANWHASNIDGVVERDGQLGHPKLDKIEHEKLGADLARLVCVPVPQVEIGTLEGQGRFAISHIHSIRSRPLVAKNNASFSHTYHPAVKVALRKASGLLPFLAWIAATDHHNDTNLVVDYLDDDTFRISAIDFEHAFSWSEGEEVIVIPASPALEANVDPLLVKETIINIQTLAPAKIHDCCTNAFGTQREFGTRIADILIRRRNSLCSPFRERGWLG
jgi:hypothetical protein